MRTSLLSGLFTLLIGVLVLTGAHTAFAVGLGGACVNLNDCDGALICTAGKCAVDPSVSGSNPATPNGSSPGATPNGSSPSATPNGSSPDAGGTVTLQNPLGSIDSLPKLIDAILGAVVELGSVLLVVMLVYVGFLFVLARGNPEEISKARGALIWTVIGGLILLGAKAIEVVITATVAGLGS